MKKLYIVGPSDNGEGVYTLVADDGEALAQHLCSNSGFARGDLERGRPEWQKEWRERFGEYEVVPLGSDDMTLDELLRRNEKWYEKADTEAGEE